MPNGTWWCRGCEVFTFNQPENTCGCLSTYLPVAPAQWNSSSSHQSHWNQGCLMCAICYHYRPQRSCEGYVFTGVCLSTVGECLVPGGLLLGGCLLWRGVCSWGGGLVPGRAWSWGVGIPECTEADPPGEMAAPADGTHPTGMHSCLSSDFCESSVQILFRSKFCNIY